MERWQCKLVAFYVMMVVMLAATLTPFRVVAFVRRQGERGKSIILTLTCFTGGVFLGTVLLFLVPEVSFLFDSAARLWTYGDTFFYPFGELVIGIGFFMVMFIERGIVELYRKSPDEIDDPQKDNHLPPRSSLSPTSSSTTTHCSASSTSDGATTVHKFGDAADETRFAVESTPECCHESSRLRTESTASYRSGDANSFKSTTRNRAESIASYCGRISSDGRSRGRDGDAVAGAAVECAIPLSVDEYGAAKTVIFFIALTFDCFLGGLSLGLQRTPAAVWTVLIGILAHEAVVGFGLGLQLAERVPAVLVTGRRRPTSAFVMAFVYACIGPIGIAVGTLINEFWRSSEESLILTLGSGIMQGFATGVFVYVTFFELLGGNVNPESRYRDLIAIATGFAVMAVIACMSQQSNDNSERHSWANSTSTTSGGNFTLQLNTPT